MLFTIVDTLIYYLTPSLDCIQHQEQLLNVSTLGFYQSNYISLVLGRLNESVLEIMTSESPTLWEFQPSSTADMMLTPGPTYTNWQFFQM